MKRFAAIVLAFSMLLLTGCFQGDMEPDPAAPPLVIYTEEETAPDSEPETVPDSEPETAPDSETAEMEESEEDSVSPDTTSASAETTEAQPPEDTVPEDEPLPASVEKDGSYTTPEDVAEYIHTFGTLPENFITKNDAKALGWNSSAGNLWDVAPGKSIGGDRFGNREGLLPDGNYRECDVNFSGGYRGSERLIYGDDGSIYYTKDHYKSFTQLY